MKTVLLVEDDRKVSLALSIRLKAMGYAVAAAADAAIAIQEARKHNPDVILLDINLPGGDGFVVADRLSHLVQTAGTPIIFITASKQSDLRQRAKAAGAVRFLEKPYDATELADAIETALMPGDDWGIVTNEL